MNRIYCSIFNAALGAWVAVPETARARGKNKASARTTRGSTRTPLFACTALAAGMTMGGMAVAQTWTGATDTDWDTGTNWTGGTPAAADTADINAAAGNQPTLGSVTPGLTATNVSAGTLTISAGGNLVSTDVNISGAGAIHSAGAITGNVSVSDTGSLTNNGGSLNGSLSLNDSGSFRAATSGTIGNLSFGDSATATISAAAGTTLTQAGSFSSGLPSGSITFGSATDTGRVVIAPSGGGVSSGLSINVAGGTLAGNNGNFGFMLNVISNTSVAAGATLDVGYNDIEVNRLGGAGTVINSSATDRVLTLRNTTTFAGAINDGATNNLSLVRHGAGTTTLTGASGYTGTTTVEEGALALGTGSSLVSTSVTVDAGAVLSTNGEHLADGTTLSNNGQFTVTGAETIGEINGTGAVTLTDPGVLTIAGAGTSTISNTFNGTGGLTFNNAGGAHTLSGTNTHAGATTLQAGGLTLAGGMAIADTGAVVVNDGTLTLSASETIGALSGSGGAIQLGSNTLTVNATSGSADYAGAISGSGGLSKTGAGTLALSGTNTYTGNTTLTGGTVAINNAGALGADSGHVLLDGGTLLATESLTLAKADLATQSGTSSTIAAANGKTLTLAGNVSPLGSNSVLNFGAAGQEGTVVASTFSSASRSARVNVAGGTLRVEAGNFTNIALGFIAGTSVAGAATLDLAGLLVKIHNLSGTGTVNSSTGIATLQTLGTSNFGGALADGAGTSNLDVYSGVLTLSGGNTYTGTTFLSGGNLTLAGAGALASTDVTITAGRTLTTQGGAAAGLAAATALTNNGVFALTGDEEIGSIAGSGAVNLGAYTLTTGGLNSSTALSGVVSGTGGLVKTGAGTLLLSGSNSYSGDTTISDGVLQGTTTSLQGDITNNATLAFDQTTDGTFAGAVSGSGALRKLGSGTLTLSGLNTYTGGTTISAGPLQGDSTSLQGNILNNATLAFDQATDGTFNGAVSGSGALRKLGSGTLTLSGLSTYTGGTTLIGGTLQGNTISLQGNILNDATLAFDQTTDGTFNGAVSGSGALLKLGNGTLTLDATNTYSGGTTISSGAISIGDGGTQGSVIGNIVNNASLLFNRADAVTYSGIISGIGDLTQTGPSPLILTGNNTYSGGTYNTSGATLSIGNGGVSGSITGNIMGSQTNIGTVIFNRSDDTDFAGDISDHNIIKRGTGTLSLTGSNIDISNLHVDNGELLISNGGLVSSTNSFISGADGASRIRVDGPASGLNITAINVGDTHAGTLTISDGGNVTATATNGGVLLGSSSAIGTLNIGAAAGDSAAAAGTLSADRVTFGSDASNIVFNHTDTNYNFAADISGNGAVELYSGLTNLTGNSSYSGNTLVSGGTLKVNNLSGSATGSSSVSIASGASLGGSGSIAGSVMVADGGRLAAGNSPGNLTLGELLLNNASVLDYELGSPSGTAGVDSDLITVTGDLTLDGILNISDLGGFDFAAGSGDTGSYRLLNYGGTLIDNVLSFGSGLLTGYNYSIDTGTAGAVTLVADFTGLQFWDGNNTSADSVIAGGDGTWSASSSNWTNQSGETNTVWESLTAVFAGAAGTVEVDGSHTVQGLQFATDGYLLTDTDSNGNLVLADAGADIRADSGISATIDIALSGNGSLSKTGAGTVTLQGDNTYTGDTMIFDGTLQLGGNERIADSSDLVINGGTFALNNFNETVANLSGIGGVIDYGDNGSGTLTVNQTVDGTYAGDFTGNNPNALSLTSALIKNGDATLTLSGTSTQTGNNSITLNAGRLAVAGGNAIADSYTVNGAGEFELLNDETIGFISMGVGGKILLNDNTLTIGTGSGAVTLADNAAAISRSGNIVIDGNGRQKFSATSTYTGSTTINSGELITDNTLALGNNSAVTVSSGGKLLLNDSLAIGSLAGSGEVNLSNLYGGHILLTGGDNTSTTFSGVLSGTGSLTKTGTGIFNLTGINSYSGGTTISDGALQGTTASLQGDIANNAALVIDQAANGTFSGVVSGSGALTKSGAGTLILSGANSYSGGTTISAGILQGTTASLQGDITNNATLAFDQVANGSFGGVVSGSGALIKSGTGTLTLSGANSYSGGTIISDGALQGTAASLQGDITNNATLAFEQGANGTFSGAVSGSGALIKSGAGTLTLSGANSYSGGTRVSGGILQGSTRSLQGAISNSAQVSFDQAADGVYAGVMSGTGSLIKSGVGMLTLTGINSYSGSTLIDSGRLAVNGSITNSATTVNAGGTLGGSGTVGSISLNGGILAPGNSIGTLNVAGDLDFSAGGVFEVEVDAAGNNDRINATGSATLTNGTVRVLPEAGDYSVSTDYSILTAAGGLGGTSFNSVSSSLAFLTPTLSYDANSVVLNLRRNSSDYASVTGTTNQGSVGTALDTLASSGATGVDELLNNLNLLTADGANQAFDSLSGVQHTYSNQIALQSLNQFKGLLFDRLQGNNQFLATNGQLMLAYNDSGSMSDAGSQLLDSQAATDRGWWLRGTGSYGEFAGTRNASGAHYNASGTATGLDFNLDDALTLGAAFGYSSTGVGVAQGDLEVDSYQAALYGRWLLDDGYYASGIAGLGYHDIDAKRQVSVGLSSNTAKADYDAWTGNVAIEAGRTFALTANTHITPLAGLEYAHIKRSSFTEKGADAADLHVGSDQQDSLRSALGARLAHGWTTRNGSRIQPTVELAWVHEFMDSEAGLRAGFASAPNAGFSVRGPELDRDRVRLGIGLNMQVSETAYLSLGYQGEIAGSDDRHDISATFRMAW